MAGGTLGELAGKELEGEDLSEVRRRSASSSLTPLAGLSAELDEADACADGEPDGDGLNALRCCLFLGMPETGTALFAAVGECRRRGQRRGQIHVEKTSSGGC
jgi:hypothetical protein